MNLSVMKHSADVSFSFTVGSHRVLDHVFLPQDRHQLGNHLLFCELIVLVVSKTFKKMG